MGSSESDSRRPYVANAIARLPEPRLLKAIVDRPATGDHWYAMNSDLRRRWERAERHLRTALPEVDLPDAHGPLVADFVEHGELGLAFEWMVEVIANSQLELTKNARRHLSGAAAELGLRANRDWRRLQVCDLTPAAGWRRGAPRGACPRFAPNLESPTCRDCGGQRRRGVGDRGDHRGMGVGWGTSRHVAAPRRSRAMWAVR